MTQFGAWQLISFGKGGELSPCRVYLAGPMTGYPEWNFPAFLDAAEQLRAKGFEVDSPAERDLAAGFDPANGHGLESFSEYMAVDLPLVCRADAVVALPGWRQSRGASLEALVATKVGKPVVEYPSLRMPTVLEEAQGAVFGDRGHDYGHPADDFRRIARLWTAWLQVRGLLDDDQELEPTDPAHMMIHLKQSRASQTPNHRDSWVDMCGYGECGARVVGIDR